MGEQRLLTAQQVADRCALSYGTVLRAIHRGELRAARLGARLRVPEEAVNEWVAEQLVKPRSLLGSLPEPRSAPATGAGSVERLVALERRLEA
jgi:excisionase family DNA binding protein